MYLFFTVLCRAPSLHWSILNNELHLSGSRLYGMVLVSGMADSCLYNKQNNKWTLGNMEFIFSCSHSISHPFAALTRSISMWTLADKFHISARPCIILYIINHSNLCCKILYIYLMGYPSNGKLVIKCFLSWTILDMSSLPAAFFTISRLCLITGLLRAAVRKYRLGVCKMKKSKILKLCQNIGLGKLFLEK